MSKGKSNVTQLQGKEAQRRINKAELLTPHIAYKDVEIPGLGSVEVRSLSVKERRKLREIGKVGVAESGEPGDKDYEPGFDPDRFDLLCIVFGVSDPDLSIDDVEALAEQDSTITDFLGAQIQMINMVGRLDTDDLKKESRRTQNSDSN